MAGPGMAGPGMAGPAMASSLQQQHQQAQLQAINLQSPAQSSTYGSGATGASVGRQRPEQATPPQGDQFPKGLRVLVVDDDLCCLKIVENMLKSCGYQGESNYCLLPCHGCFPRSGGCCPCLVENRSLMMCACKIYPVSAGFCIERWPRCVVVECWDKKIFQS